MAEVRLQGVNKFYGAAQALHGITLDIADGEFAVFVGPSGCGKSTLLRAIAGLEDISQGAITIGTRDVTGLAPSDRDVAMVFQSYALYPHMTVRENMDFGMKINNFTPDDRKRRIADAARILQLEPYLDRKPAHLSGGQRQRVAIGRAIVKEPKVFLFDEPLSNLDAALRAQMRIELSDLHRKLGATMIYVTHDQVEAMTMADKIVVLNAGQIEQVGSPMDLYNAPVSPFVAGFIGSPKMNLYDGKAAAMSCKTYGVRPEHLRLDNVAPCWTGKVRHVERLGADTVIYLDVPGLGDMIVRTDGDANPAIGSAQGVSPLEGRDFRFD